jgi:hypothetical protein
MFLRARKLAVCDVRAFLRIAPSSFTQTMILLWDI